MGSLRVVVWAQFLSTRSEASVFPELLRGRVFAGQVVGFNVNANSAKFSEQARIKYTVTAKTFQSKREQEISYDHTGRVIDSLR